MLGLENVEESSGPPFYLMDERIGAQEKGVTSQVSRSV